MSSDLLSSLSLDQMSTTGLAVVASLVLLSVWSLTVSAERLILFRRARRQSLAFARLLAQKDGREQEDWLRDAVEAAGRFPHSHLAQVVSAGLVTFQQKSARKTLPVERVIEATERAVERSRMVTLARFRRGLGSLATIATTAPFIGLFGTVVGIIHAFRSIAQSHGAGGFETVSAGIAEALVTTALGILVAIPAAWMFNYLTERIDRLRIEMESSSAELLEMFLEMNGGEADPA